MPLKLPTARHWVWAAWQLLRGRPLFFAAVGLLMQVSDWLENLALPFDWTRMEVPSVAQLQAYLAQAPLLALVSTVSSWLTWTLATAGGQAPSEETVTTIVGRAVRGLIPTALAFAAISVALVAAFVLICSPIGVAALVLRLTGSALHDLPNPALHPWFCALLLGDVFAAFVVVALSATVLCLIAAAVLDAQRTGKPTLWPAMRRAAEHTRQHLTPLATAILLCQMLALGASLAAGLIGALAGDAVGEAVGYVLHAGVAPLPVLCGVAVYAAAQKETSA